ncbi:MAG: hypothetical protein HY897_08440 [Deltaproteobacteria bacterium]|nr:hypothetical protein [Deltaproteobacteria bacterium]
MKLHAAAIVLAGFVFLGWPALSHACGVCADHGLRIRHPNLEAGALFFYWFILASVLSAIVRPKDKTVVSPHLSWKWVLGFLGVGVVAYIIALFLTRGSMILTNLIAGGVWLVFVLWRCAKAIRNRPNPWQVKVHLALNAGFFLMVVWGFTPSSKHQSVDHLIGLLNYEVFDTSEVALPKLLEHGQSAVPKLIEATDRAISDKHRMKLPYLFYALEKNCNPTVRDYLEKVLTDKLPIGDDKRSTTAAVMAYAACKGPGAAQRLIHQFDNPENRIHTAILLGGMVRTGSKAGVLFALDHSDFLTDHASQLEDGSGGSKTTNRIALDGLVNGKSSEDLRNSPLYRWRNSIGHSGNKYAKDFYWEEDSMFSAVRDDLGRSGIDKLKTALNDRGEEIRRHWEKVLE